MRALTALALAALASAALLTPAQAMTITARVSGGNIAVHTGPDDRFPIVGRIADGTEIPIDQCTQTDSDSRRGSWIGDAGHTLWPSGAKTFCRIPDYGWVARNQIVGRGLVNVTPPDFAGPGW
ncbi:hypothetical protein [Devosia chinhatensis]|uniref:Uncharacterized protein n=1 Tax=Devosia chinhatensis TaxID=429727 RepID=A0A0F5FGA6_9HYPH|nr:hypothetical protein [Devosia chinhatensis]KKB07222.1 hypothetical protein VE26_10380 [Devosia chinhatensis]